MKVKNEKTAVIHIKQFLKREKYIAGFISTVERKGGRIMLNSRRKIV